MKPTQHIFLFLLCIAPLQLSAASFRSHPTFDILFLDRQTLNWGQDHTDALPLAVGERQIVLRYEQSFGRKKQPDWVRSEPIVLYVRVESGQQLELNAIPPTSLSDARQYALNPIFELTDANGEQVNYRHYLLPFQPGFQLGRNYLTEIDLYESKLGRSSVDSLPPILEEETKPSTESPSPHASTQSVEISGAPVSAAVTLGKSADNGDVTTPSIVLADQGNTDPSVRNSRAVAEMNKDQLSQLKQLFLQLDKESQKAFQIWIIQQQ